MDRGRHGGLGLGVALLLVAGWALAPSAARAGTPKGPAPDAATPFGLELFGGIHMVLGVDVDKAVMAAVARRASAIAGDAKEKKIGLTSVTPDPKKPLLHVKLPADQLAAFERVIVKPDGDLVATGGADDLTLSFSREFLEEARFTAVDQTIKVLDHRLDPLSTTSPEIVRLGNDRLIVDVPGAKDLHRAKDVVVRTGRLAFRIVEDQETGYLKAHFADLRKAGLIPPSVRLGRESGKGPGGTDVVAWYLDSPVRQALVLARAAFRAYAPSGTMMAFEKDTLLGPIATYRTYVVSRQAPLTGAAVVDAWVALNHLEGNRPYVAVAFSHQGAKAFRDLTAANVHRRMAIVLDGTVQSAPIIQEAIPGGRCSISLGGLESYRKVIAEARDLALVLKAGALPAPVRVLEARRVGATLAPGVLFGGVAIVLVGGVIVLVLVVRRRRPSTGAPGGPSR